MDWFQYNLKKKLFFWWPSTIITLQKPWPPRRQSLFPLYIYIENFKHFLVRNHWTDLDIIWQKCSFGDPLPELFKPSWFVKKHGHQGVQSLFPLYIYIKNIKSQLVRNHSTYFNIIWYISFLMTLYQECSSHHESSKIMAIREQGLFSLYIYIENFKQLVRNHWIDFNIIWQKCSFGDPLPRLFKPSWYIKKHGSQVAGLIFPTYLYRKL